MNASGEEALSIFKKWEEEKSPVRLIFKALSAGGIFTGRVFRATPAEVVMVSLDDDPTSGLVSVSFILPHSFSFIDPRDGGKDRELLESEMAFGVVVLFASGERCTWYELPSA
jgi:hypothetical protein